MLVRKLDLQPHLHTVHITTKIHGLMLVMNFEYFSTDHTTRRKKGLTLWCFTPLSAICQLYRAIRLYWWRKRSTQRQPPVCRKSLNVTIDSSMASSFCNTNASKKILSIKIVIINVIAWFIYIFKMITGNICIPFIIFLKSITKVWPTDFKTSSKARIIDILFTWLLIRYVSHYYRKEISNSAGPKFN
jgi:hypothetical protein